MKIGDEKWYVFGYETPLAIRVTVVEIDELGIWIDEPIGHAIFEDELYDNVEDARKEMESRRERYTLEEFRLNSATFILSTRKDDNRTIEEFLKDFPEKIKDVDWFN